MHSSLKGYLQSLVSNQKEEQIIQGAYKGIQGVCTHFYNTQNHIDGLSHSQHPASLRKQLVTLSTVTCSSSSQRYVIFGTLVTQYLSIGKQLAVIIQQKSVKNWYQQLAIIIILLSHQYQTGNSWRSAVSIQHLAVSS